VWSSSFRCVNRAIAKLLDTSDRDETLILYQGKNNRTQIADLKNPSQALVEMDDYYLGTLQYTISHDNQWIFVNKGNESWSGGLMYKYCLKTLRAKASAARRMLADHKPLHPYFTPTPTAIVGLVPLQISRAKKLSITEGGRRIGGVVHFHTLPFLVAAIDRVISIIDYSSNKSEAVVTLPVVTLSAHQGHCRGLALSPDDEFLLSADNLGEFIHWTRTHDTVGKPPQFTPTLTLRAPSPIKCLTKSTDSSLVLLVCAAGQLLLVSTFTGQVLHTLSQPDVNTAYLYGSERVILVTQKGLTKCIELNSGNLVWTLKSDGPALTPDGDMIVLGTTLQILQVHSTESGNLLRRVDPKPLPVAIHKCVCIPWSDHKTVQFNQKETHRLRYD